MTILPLNQRITLPKKRSLLDRLLRWTLFPPVALAGLLLLIFVYHQVASALETRRFPLPGEMVDVGTHALHLHCIGAGSPTVLVEAGSGSWSLDWRTAQQQMARHTRVCTYDRAGYGWSEAGPAPRTAQQIADELHALVNNGGIEQPFLLVAHSFGGLSARLYADQHADALTGLVLLDARHEAFSARRPAQIRAVEAAMQAQQGSLVRVLARTGLIRVLGPILAPPPAALPAAHHPVFRAQIYQPKFLESQFAEGAGLPQSEQQAGETGTLGDLPLVVVTHDPQHPTEMPGLPVAVNQEAERVWQAVQRDLTALSTDSTFRVARGAGHNIHLERPDLVAEIVGEFVQ